jgi:hypothetical protein
MLRQRSEGESSFLSLVESTTSSQGSRNTFTIVCLGHLRCVGIQEEAEAAASPQVATQSPLRRTKTPFGAFGVRLSVASA